MLIREFLQGCLSGAALTCRRGHDRIGSAEWAVLLVAALDLDDAADAEDVSAG